MDEKQFSATLTQEDAFEFSVAFDHTNLPNLLLDEPEPLGAGRGPNAARILAAAIGQCLSASLLFCFQEARIDVTNMETKVTGTLVRNDAGRWRIGGIRVELAPEFPPEVRDRISRCLELFEDFCIVKESVRHGIYVAVNVAPQFDASLAGIG